jgi:hypothetical protein
MRGALMFASLVALGAGLLAHASVARKDPLIERGRYLVAFGACNDCHTPGWRESDGTVPVGKWMTGSNIGMRGPWGTSYPVNVRLWFSQTSEDQWLFSVRTRGGKPPMHWHDLRFLTQTDQRAIFRFIRSLGPTGKPVPDSLPPWREPTTPYVWVVPQTPKP